MDFSLPVRRIIQATAMILVILVAGITGFVLIEGYTFLDALYMTVITMSTVGFGTIQKLSGGGKVFSIILIILSTGTVLYAFTTITTFVVEGEMRHLLNTYQLNKKVSKLKDHYIICGMGRNGREAALEFERQNTSFVIIEQDEEIIEEYTLLHPDYLFIKGDATHEEVLEQANIQRAKGLVSSLSTDAENVYITLTARGMNPRLNIVARASNESTINKLKRAGADHVIIPNMIGGRRMANVLTRPALMEFVDMVSGEGDQQLHLEEIDCQDSEALCGHTLAELHIRSKTGVLVLGAKKADGQLELNLQASRKINKGDRLFILGTDEQLSEFKEVYLD
ncbi:MAG: potassium channel protein [Bacteroidota bacterium]